MLFFGVRLNQKPITAIVTGNRAEPTTAAPFPASSRKTRGTKKIKNKIIHYTIYPSPTREAVALPAYKAGIKKWLRNILQGTTK